MKNIMVTRSFFEPNQRVTIKKEFTLDSIHRILVQGIDQLGGLAQSSPFFRELRKAFPNAYIVNLVGPLTYGVMQNCPYVDEVWLFDKKRSFKMAKQVKDNQFDLTFLAAGTLRAALIAYLGKVKHRVGYDNDGTGRLLTVQLHQELHSRYRPENMFDMLRAIGIAPQGVYDREMWLSDQDYAYAESWIQARKNDQDKILAFNPFSTDPKRRWTDKGWQELLNGLVEYDVKPVMLVAPNEVEQARELLGRWKLNCIVPVESHKVTHTVAILEKVKYVMGPESGFIHMALSVNGPHVIALFNVLPPVSTFPVEDIRHKALIEESVPCAPCYLYKFKDVCPHNIECMKQLSSERVLNVIAGFEKCDSAA